MTKESRGDLYYQQCTRARGGGGINQGLFPYLEIPNMFFRLEGCERLEGEARQEDEHLIPRRKSGYRDFLLFLFSPC